MKEKILAMEAGEGLDILVAEKVMEHKLGWYTDYGFKKEYERRVITLENNRYSHIPHYSTNISAAWLIFEKLREKFPWVGIDTFSKGYRCLVIDDDKDHMDGIAYTAPLAICKCALLAVME